MKRTLAVAAALALAGALPAAAQIDIPPVRLIAGVGKVAGSPYATRGSQDGTYWLTHDAATSVQLGLETASPVRGVDLRLNLQYWKPQMNVSRFIGPGSPEARDDVYRTSVKSLTLDAVIHLPRVLESRPYMLAGAGLTHFDFRQTYYRASNQPVVPTDRTQPTLHLGLGTAWDVGRYDLFIEGSSFSTRLRDYEIDGVKLSADRNYTLTAGVRIPLNR